MTSCLGTTYGGLILMDKLVVVGAGSHCRSIISIARTDPSVELLGVLDWNEKWDPAEVIMGLPVIGHIYQSTIEIPSYDSGFVLAIGDGARRQMIYDFFLKRNIEPTTLVSARAFIDDSAIVGQGTVISHMAVISSCVKIGFNSLINTSAVLEHGCDIGNNVNVSPGATLCGGVTVGGGCTLGAGCVILPGITVGDGVIVGAGAVVTKNIQGNGIVYAGVPAVRWVK